MQYKKNLGGSTILWSLAKRAFFLFLRLMELQTLWDTEARSKIIKGVATIDLSLL